MLKGYSELPRVLVRSTNETDRELAVAIVRSVERFDDPILHSVCSRNRRTYLQQVKCSSRRARRSSEFDIFLCVGVGEGRGDVEFREGERSCGARQILGIPLSNYY